MADSIAFELVSPDRLLMSTDVAQVVLSGREGDFTVLPGHAPVVTTLRPNIVEVNETAARVVEALVGAAQRCEQRALQEQAVRFEHAIEPADILGPGAQGRANLEQPVAILGPVDTGE